MNDFAILPGRLGSFTTRWQQRVREGDELKVLVARKNRLGEALQVELKAKVFQVYGKKYNQLLIDPNATPRQLALRNSWLRQASIRKF